MDFLFGAEMPLAVRFFFAFIIVLGLIGGTAYLVRRFGADRLGAASARGRQPRLAVIDAAAVDGRRRLVLIRRDNVEHLIMIGGPTDVVVEPNIVRVAAAPREAVPGRPQVAAADTLPRAAPLGEGNMWPLQPHVEPTPVARPRQPVVEEPMPWHAEPEPPPARAPRAEPRIAEARIPEPRVPEPRIPEPRVDPLAGLAADLSRQPIAEPAALVPRARAVREREAPRARDPQPERARAAPAPAPTADEADQNLAEMAQRLEAALRRPKAAAAEGRAPETPQRQSAAAPQAAPAEAAAREEPAPALRPEPKPPQQKSVYDSLEQEMASLLGRPNSKN
jgi:flagellar protein FliO/FliZ